MDIKRVSRQEAAMLVGKRKLELLAVMSKEDIISKEFATLYGRYLAICSDESFDREINSLGV
jgi:hypothetical protein